MDEMNSRGRDDEYMIMDRKTDGEKRAVFEEIRQHFCSTQNFYFTKHLYEIILIVYLQTTTASTRALPREKQPLPRPGLENFQ